MVKRWDPLADLLGLQERMNRIFEASLERLEEPSKSSGWTPTADVYETADAFVVQLELAGLDEPELSIDVSARQLVVRGERSPRMLEQPAVFHRMERRHGVFTRTLRLPSAVEPDSLRTRLRDGVLRIELRKGARGRA